MDKIIKIAEITAQSPESLKEIAETLIQSGFQIAYNEDPGYSVYCDVLKIRTEK